MSHHDDHDHHHHDHYDFKSKLTLSEKAIKMLEHWIRHNEDHAKTYREWADKLKEENLAEAAMLIEETARISIEMNEKFSKAADLIRKNP